MSLKPCLRCGALSEGSYCPAHRPRRYAPGEWPGRGRAWMATREKTMGVLDGPCWNCGAPATQVHHVVWRSAGGTDDPLNTAALCDECHRLQHRQGPTGL